PGIEILTLEKMIGGQFAGAVEPGRNAVDADRIEGIEQIGALDVIVECCPRRMTAKAVMQIERLGLVGIGKDYGLVELDQGFKTCIKDGWQVGRIDMGDDIGGRLLPLGEVGGHVGLFAQGSQAGIHLRYTFQLFSSRSSAVLSL